jgi:SAM-dependent methyltransferase
MTTLRTTHIHEPEWLAENLMRIDGVEFYLTVGLDELHAHASARNHFLLGKNRQMIDDVLAIRKRERIEKILDVGIFKGGSAALYWKLFEPAKLVAIEYSKEPVAALTAFVDDNALAGRLVPFYETDQSDANAMATILGAHFPDRDIDLVVDDASHFYLESKATLNLALPFVRPDGLYVIEDWGWAHWPGAVWQKGQAIPLAKPALSNLLVEVMMLCGSRPDIVSQLAITPNSAVLRRGPAPLEPHGFDIGRNYLCRDRWYKPIL